LRTPKPPSSNDNWLIEELQNALRNGSRISEWYNVFGFSRNPFSEELSLKDNHCWLERREVVSKIIRQVGASTRRVAIRPTMGGSDPHFLVIGPRYVGRSALSQWLARELNDRHLPDLSITIKAFSFSWNQKRKSTAQLGDSTLNLVEDQRRWIQWLTDLEKTIQKQSISSKNLVIFFLDDVLTFFQGRTPNLSELAEEVKTLHPIFIGFLSWGEYQYALDKNSQPIFQEFFTWFREKTVFIPPFQQKEILALLEKRIFAINTNLDPFQKSSLKRISWYSLGLPGLALDLGTQVLIAAADRNLHKITKTDIDTIASRLGYQLARDRLDHGIEALQGKGPKCPFLIGRRRELILEFLNRFANPREQDGEAIGLTAKKVRESLDLSFSTVSYHLSQLLNTPENPLGILNAYQHPEDGRSTIYYLEKPMVSAMELLLGSRDLLGIESRESRQIDQQIASSNAPSMVKGK
jgi:DNA-binding transcriptional ArsR family regulator